MEIQKKLENFCGGSVATALKALVMAKKGLEVKGHSQFWEIARETGGSINL
jgi:hypothetical protein